MLHESLKYCGFYKHLLRFFLQPYYFPAIDSTLDQRCLPLGYAFLGQEPDPELACDQPTCEVDTDQPVIRLNCGHTFHRGCLFKPHNNRETQLESHRWSHMFYLLWTLV